MNWKKLVLIIIIIVAVLFIVKYSIFLFLWIRGESMFSVVSDAMKHDETTEIRHYQFLENNFNYSRTLIDSWPIKNGFNADDKILVKKIECSDIKVGDVIVYRVTGASQNMNPIAHRVIKIENDGFFQTKGDHNPGYDAWPATCENIVGIVIEVIK